MSICGASCDSYQRDLDRFTHRELAPAQEAFDRLWGRVSSVQHAACLRLGLNPDDAEEILQHAAAKLWERRLEWRDLTPGRWYHLVRTTVRHAAIDRLKSVRVEEVDEPSWHDIPDAEKPLVNEVISRASDAATLRTAASELWLGSDRPDAERLLALKLHLVHGVPVTELQRRFGLDESELMELKYSVTACRWLSFGSLAWSNDQLAGFVLRPERPLTPSELDEILQGGSLTPSDDWNQASAAFAVLYVRNGLLSEQIIRFKLCEDLSPNVDIILNNIRTRYPFRQIMRTLASQFSPSVRETVGHDGGLWRRLVFEYHCVAELPHRQIYERIAPATESVSGKFTETMLNGWIGQGRLVTALAKFIASKERP